MCILDVALIGCRCAWTSAITLFLMHKASGYADGDDLQLRINGCRCDANHMINVNMICSFVWRCFVDPHHEKHNVDRLVVKPLYAYPTHNIKIAPHGAIQIETGQLLLVDSGSVSNWLLRPVSSSYSLL